MGKKTGLNPTDRGKLGTKRSIIVDSRGVVLAAVVAPANRHESKIVEETLKSLIVKLPKTPIRKRQHLHADRGYDTPVVRRLAKRKKFIPHIARKRRRDGRGRPPVYSDQFRWTVERSHSWTNRFRAGLIRWDRKTQNYEALLCLSFAYSAMKVSWVLG